MSTVAGLPSPGLRPAPGRGGAIALGLLGALLAALLAAAFGPAALALPVAGAIAFVLVREPIALYVAFLYVGVFKDEALVAASPVDPTLGFVVLLAGVCVQRLATGRVKAIPGALAGILALMVGMLIIGLFYTPARYGQDKALRFIVLTLPAALSRSSSSRTAPTS